MATEPQGFDELNMTLGELIQRAQNPLPAYQEIGALLAGEIQKNFFAGGRPDRWSISRRAKKEAGQTLLKTGRLMKSVTVPNVSNDGIEFGSNLPYAAIHQFGGDIQMRARSELFVRNRFTRGPKKGKFKLGTKAGRGNTLGAYVVTIDARPYIVFLPDAITKSTEIFGRHVFGQ